MRFIEVNQIKVTLIKERFAMVRKFLTTSMLAGILVNSHANALPCSDIKAEAERLACYDERVECQSLADTEQRLQCFDGLLTQPRASDTSVTRIVVRAESKPQAAEIAPTTAASGSADTGTAKAAAIKPDAEVVAKSASDKSSEDFGLKEWQRKEGSTQRLEAVILDITTNSQNIDFLTLDNGQVWREIEDTRVRFKKGQPVTIEDGLFDSFNLQVPGVRRLIKVRRVR